MRRTIDTVEASATDTEQTVSLASITARVALVEDRIKLDAAAAGNVTATLSAAAMLGGILTTAPSGGAINLTTPTAALIIAADVATGAPAVGNGFYFYIINTDGTNAATLVAGTGVTLVGAAATAANTSSRFYVRYTNVTSGAEALTIYRV